MRFYRAYDLSVASDRAVPGLVEVPPVDHPDLQLIFDAEAPGADAAWQPWFESPYRNASGRATLVAHRSTDASLVRFSFDDGPAFTMDAPATQVWIGEGPAPLPYLVGPVLGIVLRLRGIACLHASAVVIDDEARVFVGAEGMGKSTLAAQFATEGTAVLTDDVVAVRARDDRWFAAPGSPRVRLWDDALAALPLDRGRVASPAKGSARSQFDTDRAGAFAHTPKAIAAIYLLEFDAALHQPVVEPITAADALPLLAANTFAHRVLGREQRADEFNTLAELISTVPVRRLRRPTALRHLAATTAAVRNDVLHRYQVYGRTIRSNRPIADLIPAAPYPSPTIDVRLVNAAPDPVRTAERYVSAFRAGTGAPMLRASSTADGSHVLDYWDGTRCSIDAAGANVALYSPPGAGDPEEFLLGLGLAFALRVQGELAVHAAAVEIDGDAILLAGLPRAGKSTLAAALHALGHEAITDDVCMIDEVGDMPWVHAGPRRLRLRGPDKRHIDVSLPSTRIAREGAPVRAIYWLDRADHGADQPKIRPLASTDAVIHLVSDTWGARLLDKEMRRQEFDRACRLIAATRTRILRYTNGTAHLAAAAQCLVGDATTYLSRA